MDDFIIRAMLAGAGVAIGAGPLGCFLVWRRMAYFGDALSHTALLGIALGLLLGLDLNLSIVAICVLVAGLLVVMQRQSHLASDTLLGIMAHSALSIGLLALSLVQAQAVRIDLMQYLFGDILAVNSQDLFWIYGGALLVICILILIWRPLLSLTVQADLARVEGVRVGLVHLVFMLLIAVVIAVAMKVVGVLLVTAMMIIPPAAARHFARTPEHMAVLAIVAGIGATAMGLGASLFWDTPTGPSIIAGAAALFVVGALVRPLVVRS